MDFSKIKIFIMDVDGTLTDGKIYIGNSGECMKAFCVKDGMGIKRLREAGIITAIITGRESDIVAYRAKELKISEVYQNAFNKLEVLAELLKKYNLSQENAAFIGDDTNDLECIQYVGLSFAPSDCHQELKRSVDIVVHSAGGCGAVREAADMILCHNLNM